MRRRWSAALGVLAVVLMGHAGLLGGWTPAPPGGVAATAPRPASPPALQTRQIAPPATPAAAVVVASEAPRAPAAPAHARRAPAPSAAAPVLTSALPPVPRPATTATAATASATPPPGVEVAAALAVPVATSAATPASAAAAADHVAIPVYATRLPPAARLNYELRRGALSGRGLLVWQPGDSQYKLTLEGRALGMAVIEQTSTGGFDAAGIAPLRFLDKRRGKDAQAANFQRDRGLVSFSGPELQAPLWPGAQDRLSWMLQLPAIVAADPARFVPGSSITLFVVGARGDASAWTFEVESKDGLSLPAGPVAGALHLRREPRRAYDTTVDVWLDPARHHLPVKVRLAVSQTSDSTEFSLQSAELP